jgi:hypothetical protein
MYTKGKPIAAMNILDRMEYYNVPEESVVDIDNEQVISNIITSQLVIIFDINTRCRDNYQTGLGIWFYKNFTQTDTLYY